MDLYQEGEPNSSFSDVLTGERIESPPCDDISSSQFLTKFWKQITDIVGDFNSDDICDTSCGYDTPFSKEFDSYYTPPSICVGQGDGPDSPLPQVTGGMESLKEAASPHSDHLQELKTFDETNADEEKVMYTTLQPAKMSCVNFETPKISYRMQPVTSTVASQPVVLNRTATSTQFPAMKAFTSRIVTPKPTRGRGQSIRNVMMPPYIIRPAISKASMSSSSSVSTPSSDDNNSSFSFSSYDEDCSSSAMDMSETSIEYPKPPTNTPNSAESEEVSFNATIKTEPDQTINPPQLMARLEGLCRSQLRDAREIHNAKERQRRSRIRDACHLMRSLLPNANDGLDNTTVFERFSIYQSVLRENLGDRFDMEFLRNDQLTKERCLLKQYGVMLQNQKE